MRQWRLFFSLILCCGLVVPSSMVGCGDDDGDGGGGSWVLPEEYEGQWMGTAAECTECGTGNTIPGVSCEPIPEAGMICGGFSPSTECGGNLLLAEHGDNWFRFRCEEYDSRLDCTIITDLTLTFPSSTQVEVTGTLEFVGCPMSETCVNVSGTGIKIGGC